MFKEIKKYGLIDKIIIIMQILKMISNLIQEVNVKVDVYVLLNMILQQHSTLKTLTRINYNRSVCLNKTSD